MTLMLLRHPNIVLMITACFSDKWRGQECIVWCVACLFDWKSADIFGSELMEGGNLYDILHVRKVSLSAVQKRGIMIGIGRGMLPRLCLCNI